MRVDNRETVGIAVLRITDRPPVPQLDDAIDRGLHLTDHVLPSSRPAANRRSDTRASKAFSLSSGGPRSTADGCAETTTSGSDIAVGRRASATGRRSTSPRCAVSRNVLPINDCAAVAPSRTTTSGRTDIISATNHGRQATTSVQGELEMFHRVGDVQPIPVDPAVGDPRPEHRLVGVQMQVAALAALGGGGQVGQVVRVRDEVRGTLGCVVRLKSRAPNSRSRRCTCLLRAAWVTFSRSAARPKCRSSATAMKY